MPRASQVSSIKEGSYNVFSVKLSPPSLLPCVPSRMRIFECSPRDMRSSKLESRWLITSGSFIRSSERMMHPRESFDEDIFCEESCSGLRFDIFTVQFFILLQIVVQYLLSARHMLYWDVCRFTGGGPLQCAERNPVVFSFLRCSNCNKPQRWDGWFHGWKHYHLVSLLV